MRAVNAASVINTFDTMVEQNGTACDFTLRDGTAFTIKGVLFNLADEQLTDGLNQDNARLQIMHKRWSAFVAPGRDPEKGDQVRIDGHRFAIQRVDRKLFQSVIVGYRMRIRG